LSEHTQPQGEKNSASLGFKVLDSGKNGRLKRGGNIGNGEEEKQHEERENNMKREKGLGNGTVKKSQKESSKGAFVGGGRNFLRKGKVVAQGEKNRMRPSSIRGKIIKRHKFAEAGVRQLRRGFLRGGKQTKFKRNEEKKREKKRIMVLGAREEGE